MNDYFANMITLLTRVASRGIIVWNNSCIKNYQSQGLSGLDKFVVIRKPNSVTFLLSLIQHAYPAFHSFATKFVMVCDSWIPRWHNLFFLSCWTASTWIFVALSGCFFLPCSFSISSVKSVTSKHFLVSPAILNREVERVKWRHNVNTKLLVLWSFCEHKNSCVEMTIREYTSCTKLTS